MVWHAEVCSILQEYLFLVRFFLCIGEKICLARHENKEVCIPMKQRSSALLALFLVLAVFCFPAFALAEGGLSLTSVSGYEDGFVVTVSDLGQSAAPDSLAVYYAPKIQEVQEAISLPLYSNVQEIPVPLPLGGNGAIVLAGLTLAPGSSYHVQIKAVYGGGQTTVLSNIAAVDVAQGTIPTAPESIAFANKTETIFEGQTLNLPMSIAPAASGKAYLTYSSSNAKVATVDESGIVTAIAKGKATITANGVTAEGKKLKATVTVAVSRPVTQVSLNNTEMQLAVGKRASLKAAVTPSSASDKSVTFGSSDESIATVDKKGSIRGIAPGSCVITAASQSNPEISAALHVTVIQPVTKLTLDAGNATIYVGQALPLAVGYAPDNASIKAVTFKSSAAKYATVDANGIVTGIARGKATITATATDGSRTKVSKSISVLQQPQAVAFKEIPAELRVGTPQKISATVSPSNTSDKTLIWTSSNDSIATVSKSGTVTPLYPGQVTITATAKDFPSVLASADFTVVQPAQKIELSESKLNILVQETAQLSYIISPDYTTDKSVIWSSSRPEVASVDQNGLVSAHKRGTATITVACQDGSKKSDKATVNVIQPLYGMTLDKDEFRIGLGETGTLTAVLDPLDASNNKVRWYSNDANIARVSGTSIKGSVTGIAWGDARITAVTDEGEYTDTAIVHVGDYNEALDVAVLSLIPREGGGYTPFIQLKNWSNMHITSVSFVIQGIDINNNLLYMGNNHAYVYGQYLQELAPGWTTESIGFHYDYPGNYSGIEKVRVAITDYTTKNGVEWHISLSDRVWAEYPTPEFQAVNPGI